MSQRIDASFSRRSRVVIRSTRSPVTLSLVPTKCWEALKLNLISSWVFSRCFGNIWSPALRWEWKWESKTRFSRKYYTNKKIYCDFEMIGSKTDWFFLLANVGNIRIVLRLQQNISRNISIRIFRKTKYQLFLVETSINWLALNIRIARKPDKKVKFLWILSSDAYTLSAIP